MDSLLIDTVAELISESQLADFTSQLQDDSLNQERQLAVANTLSRVISQRLSSDNVLEMAPFVALLSSYLCRALIGSSCYDRELVPKLEKVARACPALVDRLIGDLCDCIHRQLTYGMLASHGQSVRGSLTSVIMDPTRVDDSSDNLTLPKWLHVQQDVDPNLIVERSFILLTRLCLYTPSSCTPNQTSSPFRIPHSVLQLGLSFLGSPNPQVAVGSRQFIILMIRQLQNGTVELTSGSLHDLEPVIWTRISSLVINADGEHCRVGALAVWLQFLTPSIWPCPSLIARLETREYWDCLQSVLIDGSDPRRKYGLAVIAASFSLTSDNSKTIDRLCTVFEAIVLGRYFNQAEEAVRMMDGLVDTALASVLTVDKTQMLNRQNGLDGTWVWVLLIAALDPAVQERHRTAVGCWCLASGRKLAGLAMLIDSSLSSSDFKRSDIFAPLFRQFLIQSLLPWASQGYLFVNSVQIDDRTQLPSSTHGDLVILFLRTLLSTLDGPAASMVAAMLVDRISQSDEPLYPMALPFILAPIVDALQIEDSHIEKLKSYRPLSHTHGLSPAARITTAYFDRIISSHTTTQGHDNADGDTDGDALDIVKAITLDELWDRILTTRYASIRGSGLSDTYTNLISILDRYPIGSNFPEQLVVLYQCVNALWEQFVTDNHPKEAVTIIDLILHPRVVYASVSCQALDTLLRVAVNMFTKLSRSRLIFFNRLTFQIRRLFFSNRPAFLYLKLADVIVNFLNDPPVMQQTGLFDMAISLLTQQYNDTSSSNRSSLLVPNECSYERMGTARLLDVLNRMSTSEFEPEIVKGLLSNILGPWLLQTEPIQSHLLRHKTTTQLQAVFILVESVGKEIPQNVLFEWLLHLVQIEPMPRYRILLEWIFVRACSAHPGIIPQLYQLYCRSRAAGATMSEDNPRFITSLIHILVATSHFPSAKEEFVNAFIADLLAGSMMSKVTIRYDSQWALLVLLGCAKEKGWKSITENPILASTSRYLHTLVLHRQETRGENKQESPAHVALLRKFGLCDLRNLFEGVFLAAQPVEAAGLGQVRESDFILLDSENYDVGSEPQKEVLCPSRTVPLSAPFVTVTTPSAKESCIASLELASPSPPTKTSTALQTKGTAWKTLLASHTSSALAQTTNIFSGARNQNVILLGSLLTSATNIGGLCRCAEVLGVGTLYVHSLSVLSDKVFQSVAVSSELHLPLAECARETGSIVTLLDSLRRDGYSIVGIEQTESSVVLGSPECVLPKKVVFVLGNERTGIPADLLGSLDHCVEIRQVGVIRSLNVQTAGAVVLAEYMRQYATQTPQKK